MGIAVPSALPYKEVTPYIHAMIYHVGDFMRIHGCPLPFTLHGLEKYNDTMTKTSFVVGGHTRENRRLLRYCKNIIK